MSGVNFSYVDSALAHFESGGEAPPFWRHFHWGLFDEPGRADDSPERYFAAAEALTEHVVTAAGVADGRDVLDVGCGFGGTLDHVAHRNDGCRLVGLNIDERQVQWAQKLLGNPAVTFVTADGCSLPVASGSLDHVLAVECIFHFPSRKTFFLEVARVLRPGGTLALSDFVMAPGALALVADRMTSSAAGMGEDSWYGHMAKPLTSEGYRRLAHRTGLEVLVDDDVNARTVPTYAALRRLADEASSADGVTSIDGLEELATTGALGYHVVSFRKP